MPITKEDVTGRIRELCPEATIEIAGEDCSFEVYVVCDDFADMNTLRRQQSILALFKSELASGRLHALGIKARTQAELSANTGLVQIQS